MTIDKAIADLSIQREVKRRLGKDYQADAIKLGIEALKRIQVLRSFPNREPLKSLPGETEE